MVTEARKERERTGVLRHRTRSTGKFRYELILPGEMDDKKVEASLAEGVLTVRATKAAAGRPRRSKIT